MHSSSKGYYVMSSRPSTNAWKLLISGMRGILSIQFSTCTIPKKGKFQLHHLSYFIDKKDHVVQIKSWFLQKRIMPWNNGNQFLDYVSSSSPVLGGRLTLINSVLDALPTYMLSIVHVTQSVVQRLDKIKNFMWQVNKEKKEFHLV